MLTGRDAPEGCRVLQGRLATPLVTRVLLLVLIALLLFTAARFFRLVAPNQIGLTDFDAFHVAGEMIRRGQVNDTYWAAITAKAQQAARGGTSFMPWTYPPPFDLVAALFAETSIGWAYLWFTAASFAGYVLVLRRLAGEAFGGTLLAIFPALVVVIRGGQNGLLTGALIGLACLALRRGQAAAGIPLGLMVIKPHLAVAFGLEALLARRWGAIAVALAVAAAFSALATLILGPSVWAAFLHGVDEARGFLAAGLYPLHRMVSVYAALRSLGLPAAAAGLAQSATALLALGTVAMAMRRKLPTDEVLGLSALATLLVSPYAYDYDLPIYGIALALLTPALARAARPAEQAALLVLSLVAGGYGMMSAALLSLMGLADGDAPVEVPSLAGFLVPALLALIWRILTRRAAESASETPGLTASLAGAR